MSASAVLVETSNTNSIQLPLPSGTSEHSLEHDDLDNCLHFDGPKRAGTAIRRGTRGGKSSSTPAVEKWGFGNLTSSSLKAFQGIKQIMSQQELHSFGAVETHNLFNTRWLGI